MSRSLLGLFALPFLFSAVGAQAQETAPLPPQVPALSATGTDATDTDPNATQNTEPAIALDELIRCALANNPQPQQALNTLQAAKARAAAARATLNPTLQIVPGVGGNSASRDEEIILAQPLDLFGQRRATRRVLDAEVRRAQAQQTLAARSLVIQVKNAATDLLAVQEAETLEQSQLEIARAFRDAAARKAELGDAPPVQTQRAQLELDRAQLELEQTRTQRLSRRAILNQLIGAAPEAPLRVTAADFSGVNLGTLPTDTTGGANIPAISPPGNPLVTPPVVTPPITPTAPTLDPAPQPVGASIVAAPIVGASAAVGSDLVASRSSLLPGALQRPDILAAQAGAESSRAQAEAIGRQRRPQLEIQARRGGVFDSASTSLRAVINIPLFDFGSIKREQAAARYEALAQDNQVALLRSQAAQQVESALLTLRQNRLTAERYRTSLVPQTLDLLRKTQVGYAAGASTYLEVLEAQRATRQVQTDYLQALIGTRTAEAALEEAFGSDLPGTLSGTLPTTALPKSTPFTQGGDTQ